MVKVSVVMPVHNAGRYLEDCLSCIVRQTMTDFECICVNDASTDGSRDVLERYSREDSRFVLIDIDPSGAGKARNVGMSRARGKYLMFLDADDLFAPNMLEALYGRAEETAADIVFCRHLIYETEKQASRECTGVPFPYIDPNSKYPFRSDPSLPIQAYAPAPWNKLFRAAFVKEEGLQFQTLSNANDLCFTTTAKLVARHAATVSDALVFYRKDQAGNITSKVGKDPTCVAQALAAVLDFAVKRGILDEVQRKLQAFAAPNLNNTINMIWRDQTALKMFFGHLKTPYLTRVLGKEWQPAGRAADAKVSVVIPVYNAERTLKRAVDSLLAQTLPEIEIVIVDDGSTDGSYELAARMAKSDGRIVALRHIENLGTYQARKTGSLAATGAYLTYLDPDDELAADACRGVWQAAEKANADIVGGGAEIVDCSGLPPERIRAMQAAMKPLNGQVAGEGILRECFVKGRIGVNVCGKAIRREVAQRAFVLLGDGRFVMAEDALQFFACACFAGKYAALEKPVYRYYYGRGVTGRSVLSVDDYKRQCTEVDVLRPLDDFVSSLFPKKAAVLDSFRALSNRLRNGAYGRIFSFLPTDDERKDALAYLVDRMGPFEFVTWAAERFFSARDRVILDFDRLGLVQPLRAKSVRTIGLFYFHMTMGGVQRVISLLMPEFLRLGLKVVLILEKELDDACFRIPKEVRVIYLQPASARCTATNIGRRLARLKDIVESESIDLMYYHPYSSNILQWDLLLCKLVCRIPFVVHFHNCIGTSLFFAGQTAEFSYLAAKMRMSDKVIALSRTDDLFFRSQGVNSRYVPNPVAGELRRVLEIPDRSKFVHRTVLWCARMSWEKHSVDAIMVFAEVSRTLPDVRFVMVGGGSGDVESAVRRKVEELGLGDRVVLTGNQTSVEPYYGTASLFLMTSAFEGFPMTLVEAGAHGLPVVMYALPFLEFSRDNPGIRQIPQGDVKAAANALCNLLEDEATYARAAEASRDFTRAFLKVDQGKIWSEIIAELKEGKTIWQPKADEQVGLGEVRLLLEELQYSHLNGFKTRMGQLERLRREQATDRKRAESAEAEVRGLASSESYRLGLFLTWPLRVAWRSLKRLAGAA